MTISSGTPRVTRYHHRVRYFETDQQGVVFNMWYLGYFDEAMSLFLDEGGLAYPDMLAAGFDVQLVHSVIDWQQPLRWPDDVTVEVRLRARGRTSFVLGFDVSNQANPVASGQTTYVVVATDGSGKRPIPDLLDASLGPVGDG